MIMQSFKLLWCNSLVFLSKCIKILICLSICSCLSSCKTSPEDIEDPSIDATLSINSAPTTVLDERESIDLPADVPGPGVLLFGKFNIFPRETTGVDENGWSILTPSHDSRMIYVSSESGDDSTGAFVSPNEAEDIYNPVEIKPFATIDAALEHARSGFPDWILLKRGDVWDMSNIISLRGGRSVFERSVFTSYGAAIDRPIIKTTAKNGFRIWSGVNHVAIVGISLYAEVRDPGSPKFIGWGKVASQSGIYLYQGDGEVKVAILLEDNDINFFSSGVSITGPGHVEDLVVRRNVLRNSYDELGHSQGLYGVRASILLEENLFDHNGWYQRQVGSGNEMDGGQATMFNHNTYLSGANHAVSRWNIFLRSSSIQQKWTANSPVDGAIDKIVSTNILITDNLYVGGEIGISAGGNTDHNNGPRWSNINIIDNVLVGIGRDRPTNRGLSWYIDANDWKGGNICGNYLLHSENVGSNNVVGINISGHSSNVTASKNRIFGLIKSSPTGNGAINITRDPKHDIKLTENVIKLSESSMRVITAGNISESIYADNKYYSEADPQVWFSADDLNYSFKDWALLTGDGSSSVSEELFADENRSFETYLATHGLPVSTEEFVNNVVAQRRVGWSEVLSAQVINQYIRDGYGGDRCNIKADDFFEIDR